LKRHHPLASDSLDNQARRRAFAKEEVKEEYGEDDMKKTIEV
jgi:hypothetical protein